MAMLIGNLMKQWIYMASYGHRQSMTCLSLVTIPFHPDSMDENAHSNQQPDVVYVFSKGLEEV
jgi:hypothetical protein